MEWNCGPTCFFNAKFPFHYQYFSMFQGLWHKPVTINIPDVRWHYTNHFYLQLYFCVCLFFFPMAAVTQHVKFCPQTEEEIMLICTERKKCYNKVLNKALCKFCMRCKSINPLFSQISYNAVYYEWIHTDALQPSAILQNDSSVHEILHKICVKIIRVIIVVVVLHWSQVDVDKLHFSFFSWLFYRR